MQLRKKRAAETGRNKKPAEGSTTDAVVILRSRSAQRKRASGEHERWRCNDQTRRTTLAFRPGVSNVHTFSQWQSTLHSTVYAALANALQFKYCYVYAYPSSSSCFLPTVLTYIIVWTWQFLAQLLHCLTMQFYISAVTSLLFHIVNFFRSVQHSTNQQICQIHVTLRVNSPVDVTMNSDVVRNWLFLALCLQTWFQFECLNFPRISLCVRLIHWRGKRENDLKNVIDLRKDAWGEMKKANGLSSAATFLTWLRNTRFLQNYSVIIFLW